MASGIDAQLSLGAETTYNTAVTPDRSFEFTSESIKFDRARIDSKGLRAGRRIMRRFAPGTQKVSGSVSMELIPGFTGILLEHLIGSADTVGTVHTFEPTPVDGKSLTVQVGRPSVNGTVNPFTYTGMKVVSASMRASIDNYVTADWEFYGANEISNPTTAPLVTPTYSTDDDPFVFIDASVNIDGTEYCFTDIDIKIENALKTDRYFMCAAGAPTPKEPLENGYRKISGTLKGEFDDLTLYNIYKNNEEVPLVITFGHADGHSLVQTMNVRFDGENANVSGEDILEEGIPFMALSDVSDAAAYTAVLTNGDTTA